MKIALIGYGKMGQAIENAALSRDHEIVVTITPESKEEDFARLSEADVAIEFTTPHAAVKNIRMCFQKNLPVVVGTTGWYDDFEEIADECTKQQAALLTATNFSLGVNIFFEINKRLAELMQNLESYDVRVGETHHTEKLDAPSGTAITLVGQILERIKWKKTWKSISDEDDEDEISLSTIGIESKRVNGVPGTHVVEYSSAIDTIEIRHVANNRAGFAFGAVLAAEWLLGKKGIFTMENVIKNETELA